MTHALGDKCGSTYIDLEFKNWLRRQIGGENYILLDPAYDGKISSHAAEGQSMRDLMKVFNREKARFESNSEDIIIELPWPLEDLNREPTVVAGELTITESVYEYVDVRSGNSQSFVGQI